MTGSGRRVINHASLNLQAAQHRQAEHINIPLDGRTPWSIIDVSRAYTRLPLTNEREKAIQTEDLTEIKEKQFEALREKTA